MMNKSLMQGLMFLAFLVLLVIASFFYFKVSEDAAKIESVTVEKNRSDNVIVVGVDTESPPLRFYNSKKELIGFDVDFLNAAFSVMDKEYEFRPMTWKEKGDLLNNKEIDLIWGGLTITEKRKKLFLMSKPYIEASILVVVASDSDIYSLEDLANKKIGHQKGSFTKNLLEDFSKTNPKGTIAGLSAFTSVPGSMSAILEGKIDASVSSSASVLYYVANSEGRFRILSTPLQVNEGLSIGARLGDEELIGEVNKAIDELYANGEMDKFKKRWFNQ